MGGVKSRVFLLIMGILVVLLGVSSSTGVSPLCMRAYEEGGATAVFESRECPDWILSTRFNRNDSLNCQMSTTQGRRKYQEDRISCNLDMKLPIGNNGSEVVSVGVAAVFDGHIGAEASEMASEVFLDYFYLNSIMRAYKNKPIYTLSSSEALVNMETLKEALVRTIHNIDFAFTMEAFKNKLYAGSTAVIALLVDGQILVANVGDSKALLCSQNYLSDPSGSLTSHLLVKELTIDHNAHRVEERNRIEAHNGVIDVLHDPPLVNGHFPMTRAIGDIPLKRFGVIPVPEVTDWQPLNTNDTYLVVASDGIFESLQPQKVCDILNDESLAGHEKSIHVVGHEKLESSSPCSSFPSLADCIVQNAFAKGSTDNLSVVVIPL